MKGYSRKSVRGCATAHLLKAGQSVALCGFRPLAGRSVWREPRLYATDCPDCVNGVRRVAAANLGEYAKPLPRTKMPTDLFQKCEICAGSGRRLHPQSRIPILVCRHCDGTGFFKIGLTMGQVEAMQDDRDRLLVGLDLFVKQNGRQGEVEEARRRLRIPKPEKA